MKKTGDDRPSLSKTNACASDPDPHVEALVRELAREHVRRVLEEREREKAARESRSAADTEALMKT